MKIVSFGKRSTTNLELEVLLILEIFKKSEPEVINKMKEPHNTSCIDDETLVNFIKQSTQKKGERKYKEKRPKSKLEAQKIQKGSSKGKGTNYVPKPPPVTRSISKKERES
jgi:hypothetical protein